VSAESVPEVSAEPSTAADGGRILAFRAATALQRPALLSLVIRHGRTAPACSVGAGRERPVRGNTMTRQLTVALVALLVGILGCGKPRVTTSGPVGDGGPTRDQVPVSSQTPPETKVPPAAWQTVKGIQDGRNYTLQLPGGWKWDQDGMADNTSFSRTFTFKVQASKSFTKESADEYAKKRLEQLQRDYKNDKGKVRDQRIIKVGDVDATWLVFALDADGGLPTGRMLTHCCLRTQGSDIELKGEVLDIRPDRKESDVAAAQEDFLKISQSFRLASGK
jgi:hypothetical protein